MYCLSQATLLLYPHLAFPRYISHTISSVHVSIWKFSAAPLILQALLRLRRESSSTVTNRYVCDHSGIPPSPVRTSTVAHRQQELGGSVSSDDISIDHNGGGDGDDDYNNKHFVDNDEPGNDSDRPFIACSILHCDQGDENNTRGRDHDSGSASRREDDNAGVARVSLSFEALFDEHQAAAGTGQARAVAAEDGGQGNGSDVESR